MSSAPLLTLLEELKDHQPVAKPNWADKMFGDVHPGSLLGRISGKEGYKGGLLKQVGMGLLGSAFDTKSIHDDSFLGKVLNTSIPDEEIYGLDESFEDGPPRLSLASETARKVRDPDLKSIANQNSNILRKFTVLSSTLKKQQDRESLQAQKNENAIREKNLEKSRDLKSASEEHLEPFVGALNTLINRLNNLDLSSENSPFGGLLGGLSNLLGLKRLKGPKAAKVKLNKGIKEVETKTGTRYRDAKTGRFVSKENAIKKPLIDKAASAISATKFGTKIKAGAETAKAITPEAIKKIAAPLVSKAVGKTVLKSVPIVGAGIGLGLAAMRLVEGDVVGAGLDATSGLAGPMTAIPALVASIARDVYTEMYGVHPESDPMVGDRMKGITDAVKEVVADTIQPSLKAKTPSTAKNVEATKIPPNIKQEQKKDNTSSLRATPPPPSNQTSTPPKSDRAPAVKSDAKKVTTGAIGGAVAMQGKVNKESEPKAKIIPKKPDKSLAIHSMSTESEVSSSQPKNNPTSIQNIATTPKTAPTIKTGASGIGDVPDPTYPYLGDFADMLYFEVEA